MVKRAKSEQEQEMLQALTYDNRVFRSCRIPSHYALSISTKLSLFFSRMNGLQSM